MNKVCVRGFATVEVLLASSLFMLYASFLIGALIFSLHSTKTPNTRREAIYFAEEGIQVVKYLRTENLNDFVDGDYGIVFNNNDWSFNSTSDIPEIGFSRKISISTVNVNTKKIVSSVDWNNGIDTGTEFLVSYLTNWKEIIQSQNSTWTHPGLYATYNTPDDYDPYRMRVYGGYLNMLSIGNGNSYVYNIDYSDILSPSVLGSFPTGVSPSDSVFNNNKIFIASSNRTELTSMIMNSGSDTQFYGDYDIPGNEDALGITFANDLLFITQEEDRNDEELFVLSDNGDGTFSMQDSFNFGRRDMAYLEVYGQYAYVSSQDWSNDDLAIIDLITMTVAGGVDVNTWGAQFRIKVINGFLYVFPEESSGIRVYDISNPTSPILINTLSIGGEVSDFDYDSSQNLLFLGVDGWTDELQIFDISNPYSINLYGSYNASVPITSLTYDSANDMIIAGSSDNNTEILFITPQSPSWDTPNEYANYNDSQNYNPVRLRIYGGNLNVIGKLRGKATVDNLNISDVSNTTSLVYENTGIRILDSTFEGSKIYIASSDNTRELACKEIATSSNIQLCGTLNLDRGNNALGIDSDNGYIYLTRASGSRTDELVKILDNGNGTFSEVDSLDFPRSMYYIKVKGNYAYVSSQDWNDNDLVIVDINSMSVVGGVDVGTWGAQFRMDVINNYLFVFPEESSGVRIYSISNPTTPILVDTIDVGGEVTDFNYHSGSKTLFLAVDGWESDLQIFDVTNPSNIQLTGEYETNLTISSVLFDSTRDLVILGSSNNGSEIIFLTQGF